METAIAIEGLQKNVAVGFWGRPKRLLHDVTLQVQSGAVFGFIGQNGAGKSTTIKHLVGVMKPSAGSVQIFGNAPRATAARKSIGYLPEMPRLPANLMPLELLEHHARLLGIPVGDRKKSIEDLVHEVDIHRFCNQRVRTLSKGNQQRVALALAEENRTPYWPPMMRQFSRLKATVPPPRCSTPTLPSITHFLKLKVPLVTLEGT